MPNTREKLIELANAVLRCLPWGEISSHTADDVADHLIANGVTIPVRCGECKHYRHHPNGMCYAWTEPCTNERGYKGEVHCAEPDDFCSYGERREGE